MADDTDWRWTRGAAKLRGQVLHRRDYHAPYPGWDHDHCFFCWAKFSESIEGALSVGWTTGDEYYWFYDSCCDDFKDFLEFALFRD